MTAVVLRGIAQRRLRVLLTALAVVLGVAMVSGTYVQTDQIRSAFEQIQDDVYSGTDVVVKARTEFDNDLDPAGPLIPASLVAELRQVPGVGSVSGALTDSGSLVIDGDRVRSDFAPAIFTSIAPEPFNPFDLVDGRMPAAPGEIVIDPTLAKDEHVEPGERVKIATRTGVKDARVVGTVEYGSSSSLGGATLIAGRLADVQAWSGRSGRLAEIDIAATEGVAATELRDRIDQALPHRYRVKTGAQTAADEADRWSDQIDGFLTPLLLIFAGAALLVGALIIFNTFSITVAQRLEEFALLRAIGASRRQVLAAVVAEAVVIGIVASACGMLLGLGVAAALGAMFDAIGFGIPRGGLELAPRTIAVSAAIGIGVTLASGLFPALRATRVPPLAATRPDAAPSAGRTRVTTSVAAALTLGGAALLTYGALGPASAIGRVGPIVLGVLLTVLGVALGARHVVVPLARVIGAPLARFAPATGALARENAMRSPARTATTAASLMVGLALVVFVATLAAGLKSSLDSSLDDLIRADLIVTSEVLEPLPPAVGDRVAATAGVAASSPQFFDRAKINDDSVNGIVDVLNGADPAKLEQVYRFDWVDGPGDAALRGLGTDDALADRQFLKAHDLDLGDRFLLTTSSGGRRRLQVTGVYDDPQILQGIVVHAKTFAAVSSLRDPWGYFVATDPGVSPDAVADRIDRALAAFPGAKVRTNSEYREYLGGYVDDMANLLYVLVAMSLLIALIGIANGLALAIHERTRELGLLRAVGMTRRQIRSLIRYESAITALIGGLLGTALGIGCGALATAALDDFGLAFAVPVTQLVLFLVLAVAVGVLGAVAPARRAAHLDVLRAVSAR